MKKSLIVLSCFAMLMLAGCQTHNREEFDPETAALARMRLGLGYLAKANESEENVKAAHYNLKLASQYSPNNPQVMLAMAMFDQHVGEYDEAEMIYKRITLMQPGNGLYHVHYGSFLCGRDRYQEAQKQFEQSLELDKHRWKADAYEQYGYCAIQNGDKKIADLMFKQLFEYDSSRRSSVIKTAEIYENKGDQNIANYLFLVSKK
ncbi:tetratricopeptide repeat protein [Gilliamella apicola]|uniref:tetratricopeptide repeat protein n=1 Tax=Gilliamella apicola TaxID=1196095 RepID=UPI002FEE1EC3